MTATRTPMELRMTVEGMRHEMVKHLGIYRTDLAEQVGHELGQAFEEFDFTSVVRAEAEKVLNEATRAAVASTIKELTYDSGFRDSIKQGIKESHWIVALII